MNSCRAAVKREPIQKILLWLTVLFLLFRGLLRSQTPTKKVIDNPGIANFTDLAEKAGLTAVNVFGGVETKKYIIETTGTGVAIFDYDNDGWPDIFVVNGTKLEGLPSGKAPTSHLYHNNGDGTFTDASEKAHVAGSGKAWGTGCAFVDYDRDGKLDLMVANYVDYDSATALAPGERPSCMWKGVPVMCGPRGLPWAKNILYHNLGNGVFEDVTTKANIDQTNGHYSFSVSTFDYDDDGWPDIFVACDSTASILYHNNHDGTFTDVAVISGAAFNDDGREQAGMGSTVADYDGDGKLDLLKTNFSDDTSTLYRNNGDGTFEDISTSAGPAITAASSSRGLAVGDLWNDGRMSAVISNMNAPPSLLVNDARNANHWVAFVTQGAFSSSSTSQKYKSNRDAIGARITLKAGPRLFVDEVRSGSSYISNNDMRVHFGLGAATKIDSLEVRWPSGLLERFENLTVDAIHTLKEGSGTPAPAAAKKN